ncbi:MAG: hypothetical protein Q8R76_01820 [Candidatus Omnitrophota bacterium]|nr:hypothetical protein [Candidatus Omnitrophota bacterium]
MKLYFLPPSDTVSDSVVTALREAVLSRQPEAGEDIGMPMMGAYRQQIVLRMSDGVFWGRVFRDRVSGAALVKLEKEYQQLKSILRDNLSYTVFYSSAVPESPANPEAWPEDLLEDLGRPGFHCFEYRIVSCEGSRALVLQTSSVTRGLGIQPPDTKEKRVSFTPPPQNAESCDELGHRLSPAEIAEFVELGLEIRKLTGTRPD